MNPHGILVQPNGCWEWQGRVSRDGYSTMALHRKVYEEAHGPIPAGLVVDHVCHNQDPLCPGGSACRHRRCLNPEHLEAVTHAENMRRARLRRNFCIRGHLLEGWNLMPVGARFECRECLNMRTRRYNRAHPKPNRYKPPPRPCHGCGKPTRSIKRRCLECYRAMKLAQRGAA